MNINFDNPQQSLTKQTLTTSPRLAIKQAKYVLMAPSGYGNHTKNEKQMVKDKIEFAFSDVEINLRILLTLMVTKSSANRSFSQLKHKKSEYSNNETRKVGSLISADD